MSREGRHLPTIYNFKPEHPPSPESCLSIYLIHNSHAADSVSVFSCCYDISYFIASPAFYEYLATSSGSRNVEHHCIARFPAGAHTVCPQFP